MVTKYKIRGVIPCAQFIGLPFGRQIDILKQFETFKASAQSTHLSQKRQTYTKAIREFCKMMNVSEYYCRFNSDNNCFDDTFQFWYTINVR